MQTADHRLPTTDSPDSNRPPPIAGSRLAPRSSLCAARGGFTLFELILAIALSTTLLALIGTAISLYLLRVDASRTRIEDAQLARGILAVMADDLRAAFVFEPQDTSSVAELSASAASYDVDSIDAPNPSHSSGSSGLAGTAGSGAGLSSSTASGSLGTNDESDAVLPLGVHGTLDELIVDISRLPRLDELLATAIRPAPVPAAGLASASQIPRISEVKTVRYFVRQGTQVDPASPAATSLAPEGQASAGGLVRQEIDRAVRAWAEQSGNQTLLETAGLALVAPEVVHVEFRYFSGAEVFDRWDMQEMGTLPRAIEVRIWIASADAAAAQNALQHGLTSLAGTDEYRQTVYLPLSALSCAGAGSSTSASPGTSGAASTTYGSGTTGETDQ